jgi:hypothetical protein
VIDGGSIAASPHTSTPRRIRPGRTGGTRPVQRFGTAWAAWAACAAVVATLVATAGACAQPAVAITNFGGLLGRATHGSASNGGHAGVRSFRSEADSLEWESAKAAAERARGFRLVIGLFERRLWAVRGDDTLRVAEVGVGMDSTLAWQDTVWQFHTPRGRRAVRHKEKSPIWVPPDWHYVETALRLGLRLEPLRRGNPVTLPDGRRIEIRADRIVLVDTAGTATPLVPEEEIIFDGTLYMPPFSTRNRRIAGELGPYKLDLGSGYLIHGTPHYGSIGRASTHGCIRLADDDIAWLYDNVPVGTRVYIY